MFFGEIKPLCGRARPRDEASASGALTESFRGKDDNLTEVIGGKEVSEGERAQPLAVLTRLPSSQARDTDMPLAGHKPPPKP